MNWRPITAAELWDEINRGVGEMTVEQLRLWHTIKLAPQKWKLSPWGDEGGGLWIVAILGRTVISFNDIEHGFNRSHYSRFGIIDHYWCNQDELNWTVQHLLNEIQIGQASGHYAGPPEPIAEQRDAPESRFSAD